ncbi:uncharacterized protein LOC127715516 [Mytilus californianus]|uniref:uncharacterized protein LOC127715516 n=1 Tax=Mytilus californianus TaxID=6549 RepID=UPI002245FD38|nr:uncharacterized protein LOC127715516 [Mytilus californianus]
MDPGHIIVLIVVIVIGIVLFIGVCACCMKMCDTLFTCCSYLKGKYRSKRTDNREKIRYSGFSRQMLQHQSTETQKVVPMLYAKPTTIKLTRTESTCVICLEPKDEADIVALRCAHTFHGSCIRKSLNNKQECPVCRTPLYTLFMENVV